LAKKGNSKIYKTKLLTNKQGDVGFYHMPNEVDKPLPAALAVPYKFVVADHFMKEARAKDIPSQRQRDLELMRIDAMTEATLVETFSERWNLLHKHYKTDGSAKGWQKLAVELARQYIPGLRIEYVHPSDSDLRKMKKIGGLVLEVAHEYGRLRLKETAGSAKVAELDAIKAVYKKWPAALGKKPKTLGALSTEYYMRAKPQFDQLALGYTVTDLGLPTTKKPAREK
jgi:hypothetical protein